MFSRFSAHSLALALAAGSGCKAVPNGTDPVTDGKSHEEPDSTPTSSWLLVPDDSGGAVLHYDHAPILQIGWVFWGAEWSWAAAEPTQRGTDEFVLDVRELGVQIRGHGQVHGNTWTVDLEIDAARTLHGVVGGGLQMRALVDPARLGLSPPVLDDHSLTLAATDGEGVRIEIDPPPLAFARDAGDQANMRAFLVGPDHAKGTTRHRLTVTLPTGARVGPQHRYAAADVASWHADTLAWDRWPIDVRSAIASERPAGKRGAIRVDGDRFVHGDGTPARLWGTNVVAYGLFTGDRDAVANQAKRLAALGFDLVRIHHQDSGWVDPNVFDRSTGSTRKLRDESLAQLDWWVKCLQDEGIHVWLDLHVGRTFTAADGIAHFEALAAKQGEAKGFAYLDADVEARMQEFARAYLDRENRFTKRRYVDDPGVVAVLVTNENDLCFHFGNWFSGKDAPAFHGAAFARKADAFADRHRLPREAMRATWQAGPAKLLLADLEATFAQRQIADLRDLGWSRAVATTSYWGGGLYCIPSLTVGDVVDVHAYGEAEVLGTNPRHVPTFVHWAGSAQVAGMPHTMTEWNIPAPATDRFVGPLYVAAIASLQGWDAPMQYAYLHNPVQPPTAPNQWSSLDDAAVMAMMPAAAVAFRRGDVAVAKAVHRFDLGKDDVYARETSAVTSAALRTAMEQSRVVVALPDAPELDWDRARTVPEGEAVADLQHDFIGPGTHEVRSDTGEIVRDWAAGLQTIDTPRTRAAHGWIGGRTIDLSGVEIAIETPKAAVAVTSLDGEPIDRSAKVLVSWVARVEPSPGGVLPLRAEPVRGRIVLPTKAKFVHVQPLMGAAPSAAGADPWRVDAKGGEVTIELPAHLPTHWLLVLPDSSKI